MNGATAESVLIAAVLSLVASPACHPAGLPVAVPVVERHATFTARPRTASGSPLRLLLDSGGGGPLIFAKVAARVAPAGKLAWACGAALPFVTRFAVAPDAMRAGDPIVGNAIDGILGGTWFDGHVWTWDYGAGTLVLRAPGDDPYVAPAHAVALGFQTDRGAHTTGFARIPATIDGKTYQFLLDTGAHTRVTPTAQRQGNFPAAAFATNFVGASIAARWHAEHPSWPYVAKAEIESGAAMIQVPAVEIGGYRTGPAWFTLRRDASYSHFMSSYMDAPVVGSIGGETLKRFRLTIDYPKARAYFERSPGG